MSKLSIKSKIAVVASAATITLILIGSAVQIYYVKSELKEVLGTEQFSMVTRVAGDLDIRLADAQEAIKASAKIIPTEIIRNPKQLEKLPIAEEMWIEKLFLLYELNINPRLLLL